MKYNKKGEEYISAFPKFKKWINECSCCHAKGYNPSMPKREKLYKIDKDFFGGENGI